MYQYSYKLYKLLLRIEDWTGNLKIHNKTWENILYLGRAPDLVIMKHETSSSLTFLRVSISNSLSIQHNKLEQNKKWETRYKL